MEVKLISYSQPVENLTARHLIDAQDLIAFCAKVSNPNNQINSETSEKLIKYLIKHKHWSPLEMVNACLEINTTRDIAHQIVRHRSFSFQEFSQRYANPEENSVEVEDKLLQDQWNAMQQRVIEHSKLAYDWAIEHNIAKEQARVVLPEGNTKTRLYMNGSLRSWVHYIELRSANGTQKEHMEIAQECATVIAGIFPIMGEL